MGKRREKSQMELWAEQEIKLACSNEKKDAEYPEDWDYGCACYNSAFKAFKSLLKDGHSGMSIGFTKYILNRLIDGQCLTPIDDVPEVWNEGYHGEDGKITYQCKRMSSLFKDVYPDGTIIYSDINRYYCQELNNPNNTYTSGLVSDVLNDLVPITMPYTPPSKKIKVICTDYLSNPTHGDDDTIGILYAILPDDKRLDINVFFGENKKSTFVQIGKRAYQNRVKKAKILKTQRDGDYGVKL